MRKISTSFVKLQFKDYSFIALKHWLDGGFLHGFFLGPPDFKNNYNDLSKNLKSDQVFLLNQIHGTLIEKQSLASSPCSLKDADGWLLDELVCQKKNAEDLERAFLNSSTFGIKTADCLPLILYSKSENIAGLLHAGWKGVKGNYLKVFLENFKENNFQLAAGPSAGSCCYEVEKTFAEDNFSNWLSLEGVVRDSNNQSKCYLSLSKIIYYQALDLGFKMEDMFFSNLCTVCSKECYSFRRDKENAGRQLSFALSFALS